MVSLISVPAHISETVFVGFDFSLPFELNLVVARRAFSAANAVLGVFRVESFAAVQGEEVRVLRAFLPENHQLVAVLLEGVTLFAAEAVASRVRSIQAKLVGTLDASARRSFSTCG